MSKQILFFKKAVSDFSYSGVSASASEGNDFAAYALNRSNSTAWVTTGSVDANNTTWEVDFTDEQDVTDILLVKHNFKSFKVEYWNGSSYVAFSTPIDETANTATTNHYIRSAVTTRKLRLTVRGTLTANEDKYLFQFIATRQIGRLNGWPVIGDPKHTRNRKKTLALSGKSSITENVGGFSCRLTVKEWRDAADIAIVQALYNSSEGFLVWLSGGDQAQFWTAAQGYRLEDIYLMKCANDFEPEYAGGMYQRGLALKIELTEVTD